MPLLLDNNVLYYHEIGKNKTKSELDLTTAYAWAKVFSCITVNRGKVKIDTDESQNAAIYGLLGKAYRELYGKTEIYPNPITVSGSAQTYTKVDMSAYQIITSADSLYMVLLWSSDDGENNKKAVDFIWSYAHYLQSQDQAILDLGVGYINQLGINLRPYGSKERKVFGQPSSVSGIDIRIQISAVLQDDEDGRSRYDKLIGVFIKLAYSNDPHDVSAFNEQQYINYCKILIQSFSHYLPEMITSPKDFNSLFTTLWTCNHRHLDDREQTKTHLKSMLAFAYLEQVHKTTPAKFGDALKVIESACGTVFENRQFYLFVDYDPLYPKNPVSNDPKHPLFALTRTVQAAPIIQEQDKTKRIALLRAWIIGNHSLDENSEASRSHEQSEPRMALNHMLFELQAQGTLKEMFTSQKDVDTLLDGEPVIFKSEANSVRYFIRGCYQQSTTLGDKNDDQNKEALLSHIETYRAQHTIYARAHEQGRRTWFRLLSYFAPLRMRTLDMLRHYEERASQDFDYLFSFKSLEEDLVNQHTAIVAATHHQQFKATIEKSMLAMALAIDKATPGLPTQFFAWKRKPAKPLSEYKYGPEQKSYVEYKQEQLKALARGDEFGRVFTPGASKI